jgi:predicted transcriptional regulator
MTTNAKDFTKTLKELNTGISIRQITTYALAACSETDSVEEVMRQPDFDGFDFIPVKNAQGRIISIIERIQRDQQEDLHESRIFPIDVSMLVSPDAPIDSLFRCLSDSKFKLVFGEEGIEGIVTKSDLLKLPVRIFVFSHITYFESLMGKVIGERIGYSFDNWQKYLSENRKELFNTKLVNLKKHNLDPSSIEVLDFCDKREILKKHFEFGTEFRKDLEKIEQLRNLIAHSGTYIKNEADVVSLLNTMELLKATINQLEKL